MNNRERARREELRLDAILAARARESQLKHSDPYWRECWREETQRMEREVEEKLLKLRRVLSTEERLEQLEREVLELRQHLGLR